MCSKQGEYQRGEVSEMSIAEKLMREAIEVYLGDDSFRILSWSLYDERPADQFRNLSEGRERRVGYWQSVLKEFKDCNNTEGAMYSESILRILEDVDVGQLIMCMVMFRSKVLTCWIDKAKNQVLQASGGGNYYDILSNIRKEQKG